MAFKTVTLAILLVMCLVVLPNFVLSQRPLSRGYDRIEDVPTEVVSEPRKRPFCNAFTGCGRKRSSPPQEQLMADRTNLRKLPAMPIEDSIETLIDMNSEPAVEDLSRQILSEAKMWEAIQEAGAELMRRRQLAKAGAGARDGYPAQLNVQ